MFNRDRNPRSAEFAASPSETREDFRARVVRDQADALQLRKQKLVEQASSLNSPERRIRIWEHLHAIALPTSANHSLLAVVASSTGLTLEQVQEEQRKRQEPMAAVSEISA